MDIPKGDDSWMNDLDLDPDSPWLKMGTRTLGTHPWLVADSKKPQELELRARLLAERRDEVYSNRPIARSASQEVYDLVSRAVGEVGDLSIADPLERAGRMIQEDLVLLQDRDGAWHFDAGCLCFPSLWKLSDKIGRPMLDLHGPVDGYPDSVAAKVHMMMGRLGARPVWRRNWFVHASGSLFQPKNDAIELVPSSECGTGLFVRSERQTLRSLPDSGWVLFTIRIQHSPLGEFLSDSDRKARFHNYVLKASEGDLTHRGLGAKQVVELASYLGRLGPNL